MPAKSLDEIVSLCKRRGFLFQGSEIYGGLQGIYDYGPLGVELKNNLKASWWKSIVYERDDVEGLDASILTNKLVLKQSGHEATFVDPLVDCKDCKNRMRADHLKDGACEKCGSKNLTDPRPFNMMFKTTVGPVADDDSYAYLRPETAQGIFTNFKNVLDSTARKLPFGIAQIGKAFRNEITPRNFIFRVREFEQMELEFFVEPGSDEEWHQKWVDERIDWWVEQGIPRDRLEIYNATGDELAHYSKATVDIMYHFPHGVEELEGIASRTDYDLGSHTKAQKDYDITAKVNENSSSSTKLVYTDPQAKKAFVPFVIEPSAGVDRGVLAVLNEAYHLEDLGEGKQRTVLKIKPHLSPIKAAVMPLAKNNEEIVGLAKELKKELQALGVGRVLYENVSNIGKGYRRHDEVGTPLCITVDFDSLEDGTVTVRDRDSMEQERVSKDELAGYFLKYYGFSSR